MSNVLQFVLDGELVQITAPPPTRTVLQHLREDLLRLGSKEGCAEGDCGACTVVTACLDEDSDSLTFQAVNACIAFLPSLHGKALFTVESLTRHHQTLHPVQQVIIDEHASQCGFCTPGFVMSLFAQYQSDTNLNRREWDEVLSGNLCRCTGYRPIIDAAMGLPGYPQPDTTLIKNTLAALRSMQPLPELDVKTNNQRYYAPHTADNLAHAIATSPDAKIVAGGTDIGLWVTKQQRHLAHLINIASVSELNQIQVNAEALHIGAAVNLHNAAAALIEHYPALTELFTRFASVPIRNSATLAGNIANGSPIGDSMPALLALDARLKLRQADQSREVNLADFYLGYQHTALVVGEFIEQIIVPRKPGLLSAYKVSKRFDQDISAVCAAFYVELDKTGQTIMKARVAFGGMAAIPSRAHQCEQTLENTPWHSQSINSAGVALAQDFQAISDMRASDTYRNQVAANLLQRFYLQHTQIDLGNVYDLGR